MAVHTGHRCSGVTLEEINQSYQWFSFSPQWLGPDGLASRLNGMVVALQIRSDADPVDDVFDPDLTVSPLSVEYSPGTQSGTAKETYKSFGATIATRDNIDPGFGEGSTIDDYLVHRPGPRITFAVIGSEYRAYKDFGGQTQELIAVVASDTDGPTFPLRLAANTGDVTWTAEASISNAVLNVTRGGDQLSTIYSVRDQIAKQGSQQMTLYGEIYQTAKSPLPEGERLRFIAPPP